MNFGEIIVLAIIMICLHGLYDAVITSIRRNYESTRFEPQEQNEYTDR